MDVRMYRVKANSQACNTWVCNDNTKMPKPKDIQLGVSKMYAFCQNI